MSLVKQRLLPIVDSLILSFLPSFLVVEFDVCIMHRSLGVLYYRAQV